MIGVGVAALTGLEPAFGRHLMGEIDVAHGRRFEVAGALAVAANITRGAAGWMPTPWPRFSADRGALAARHRGCDFEPAAGTIARSRGLRF
jgi:hypothetical protein